MTSDDGYLFDNQAGQAGDRFGALSALFDVATFEHLEALGAGSGWRCWEVGGGGGSVVRWLADRVGPTGSVMVTDLDVRWLEDHVRIANVRVERRDVARDAPPAGQLDLVHERLVLVHVPERIAALERMASALRPGGWLLVEDFDTSAGDGGYVDAQSDVAELSSVIAGGVRQLLRDRGADPTLGRRLPAMLRDAGLVEVGTATSTPLDHDEAVRQLLRANIVQVADQLVDHQIVTREDLDDYVDRLDRKSLRPTSPTMVSAWAKRPMH